MKKSLAQSGQVALIVLLIMVVTLGVALSLARSTTKEINQVTQGGGAVKIFSAAESGTEQIITQIIQAMKNKSDSELGAIITNPRDVITGEDADPESVVEYSVVPLKDLNVTLLAGESTQINFINQDGSPLTDEASIMIEWGQIGSNCADQSSILIGRYYDDNGKLKVVYDGVGPLLCDDSRNVTDGFKTAAAGSNYANKHLINITPNDRFIRLIAVYNKADLLVSSDSVEFPTQQYLVRTQSTNLTGEKLESKVVSATLTNLNLPSYLDYAVYSGENLEKL